MKRKTQVQDGWEVVRLGDVVDLNPRRPKLSVSEETLVTFLPMNAVANDFSGILARDERPYRDVAKGYTYFEEGDVLFSKITPCLQNGKHTLATGLNGGFGFGTTEFHVVRAGNRVSAQYVFRVLTQTHVIEQCSKSFTGTAGQQRVQSETLKSLRISVPPLAEQHAIAAVLDSIDEAIERTEAVIAATERLRDALLHELLTRGVPGWHSEWKETPGIGTIPACWEVVSLGEILKTTTYGTNVSLDGKGRVPILRMNNLQDGKVDLSDVRRADLADKALRDLNLVSGDILFNRTNSLDLVGKVAIVRNLPQPISFASYLVRLRVQEVRANPFWLSVMLSSSSYQSRIRRFATPGVSQANINPTSLKSLMIPLPSLAEQRAVTAVLDGTYEAIRQEHEERETLQALKASLADALLTGRVRVATEPSFKQ